MQMRQWKRPLSPKPQTVLLGTCRGLNSRPFEGFTQSVSRQVGTWLSLLVSSDAEVRKTKSPGGFHALNCSSHREDVYRGAGCSDFLCHLQASGSWPNSANSLSVRIFICKMGLQVLYDVSEMRTGKCFACISPSISGGYCTALVGPYEAFFLSSGPIFNPMPVT